MKRYSVILVMALVLFAGVACGYPDSSVYDGHWWSALSVGEQERFLDGVSDCYIYDAHGRYALSPAAVAAKKVSEFYNRRPDQKSTAVLIVYRGLEDKGRWASTKHGYFDGEFWRVIERKERLAFVRGYLACRIAYTKSKISEPPEACTRKISTHYKVGDEGPSDTIDLKAAPEKIGDVLSRYCR